MRRLLFVLLILVVLMGALVAPVTASGSYPTVTYVVKPGDTLASIARQFCTTWQQIYHMNKAVIGPNPNVLRAGTVLQVPNQCGGQPPPPKPPPPPPGGCNLGPIPHAMGPLNGNIYTVVAGDTLFSIARRFCTTVNYLAATNHIPNPARIYVGQKLVVPVGTAPQPPPQQRYLTMSFPTNGAVLPVTWTATGTGAGLFEGNVVVTAFTSAGVQIAQQATILQGANVGTGGPGTWSATLTTNVAPGTTGYVVASSPQSNVTPVRANVTYGQGQPQQRYLTMTFPTNGAVLPGTWTATGTGAGLFEGNVVVTAFTSAGVQIAQQATTLQGANVGTGGPGAWSATLTTNVAPGTTGYVVASSPQSNVPPVQVNVTYGQPQPGASILLTSPPPNSVLPQSFVVSGSATGITQGTIVVRGLNNAGAVLGQTSATVPGGSGLWTVVLTVNAAAGTPGFIQAYWSDNTSVATRIPVTFSGAAP